LKLSVLHWRKCPGKMIWRKSDYRCLHIPRSWNWRILTLSCRTRTLISEEKKVIIKNNENIIPRQG
jgi:hypothetical protein